MPTEITFSGGHSITVAEEFHLVKQNIEETANAGKLLRYSLANKRDAGGSLIEVHVNGQAVAYISEKPAASWRPV